MMEISKEQVHAGQAVYTKSVLVFYDLLVGFNMRFAWQCPASKMVDRYNQFVSNNHLDVGVGSGFYLDHCRFPTQNPRLALMDLNPNSLHKTARRIARYQSEIYRANILGNSPQGH